MSGNAPRGPVPTLVVPANPAAGADLSFAFTKSAEIIAVSFKLATSATVANRQPAVEVTDASGNVIFASPSGTVTAASLTTLYSFFQGASANNVNSIVSGLAVPCPIPNRLIVAAGWLLKTLTAGIQAADQISAIEVLTQPLYT